MDSNNNNGLKRITRIVTDYSLVCLLAAILLSSCKDSFDLDTLENPSKMVVYCFPSEADTTYISVSNSVGVRKYTDTRKTALLKNARVSYTVNGEQREVRQEADGTFFVVGAHHAGDNIALRVEHDDYATVEAKTTVPQYVPVELQDVRTETEYDSYMEETCEFYKLKAIFTDPKATDDYYAVRVAVRSESKNVLEDRFWPVINTSGEPLLHRLSDIDEDFGYENDFYGQLYIFSDEDIKGQTYTLRLNIRRTLVDNRMGEPLFQVVLYRIAPEYYRFLKSLNDMDNNQLAEGGFAQLTPTFTNINGGIGVLGAYMSATSQWRGVEDADNYLK